MLAEVHRLDRLPLAHTAEYVLLDVLAHVLNDGALSLHGGGLLLLGLLAQLIESGVRVKNVAPGGVLSGLAIHLVQVNGADLVKLGIL